MIQCASKHSPAAIVRFSGARRVFGNGEIAMVGLRLQTLRFDLAPGFVARFLPYLAPQLHLGYNVFLRQIRLIYEHDR